MITFDIITIFPEIFKSYLKEGLISRAQKKKLIKINVHDLRKWAQGRHKTVDDRPFGGGFGMVLKVEPIYRAVESIKKKSKAEAERSKAFKEFNSFHASTKASARDENEVLDNRQKPKPSEARRGERRERSSRQSSKVILFTPRGRKFNQRIAYQLSKLNRVIMICGRYEGVDERVAKHIADLELSIGDYDLMGGELPAMVVIETVARLIPGVLGKPELLKERITKEKGFIEYAQYTRPEIFDVSRYIKDWKIAPPKFRKAKIWRVPKVLLSGNHKKIEKWREEHRKTIGN